MSGKLRFRSIGAVAAEKPCQLAAGFVKPCFLVGISSPVDQVLKFMGENAQHVTGRRIRRIAIEVYDFAFVGSAAVGLGFGVGHLVVHVEETVERIPVEGTDIVKHDIDPGIVIQLIGNGSEMGGDYLVYPFLLIHGSVGSVLFPGGIDAICRRLIHSASPLGVLYPDIAVIAFRPACGGDFDIHGRHDG